MWEYIRVCIYVRLYKPSERVSTETKLSRPEHEHTVAIETDGHTWTETQPHFTRKSRHKQWRIIKCVCVCVLMIASWNTNIDCFIRFCCSKCEFPASWCLCAVNEMSVCVWECFWSPHWFFQPQRLKHEPQRITSALWHHQNRRLSQPSWSSSSSS